VAPQSDCAISGTICGVAQKTTIYLPADLKAAVEREARRRGCSEAQVIRDAVTDAVSRPRPRPGLVDGEPFAEHVDELLTGFGER
jgi:Ribbon-helix-helix protein, copG family